jgi:small subunit ribosomal protein S6
MPVYDTTFILNPQLEESGLDSRIQEYISMIGNNGGKMVKENRMGMRRMAYMIENLNQGYYVNLIFDGTAELVNELERRMRLDEACLRFLTCRYQDFSIRRKDKRAEAEARKEAEREERREPKAEEKPEEKPEQKPVEPPAETAPTKPETTEEEKSEPERPGDELL